MTEPATINYLANLASTFRPVYKRSWSEYDESVKLQLYVVDVKRVTFR